MSEWQYTTKHRRIYYECCGKVKPRFGWDRCHIHGANKAVMYSYRLIKPHPQSRRSRKKLDRTSIDSQQKTGCGDMHRVHVCPEDYLVQFEYRNHKGQDATRTVRPLEFFYGTSDHYARPGILMRGWCMDRDEERVFSMLSIRNWRHLG